MDIEEYKIESNEQQISPNINELIDDILICLSDSE